MSIDIAKTEYDNRMQDINFKYGNLSRKTIKKIKYCPHNRDDGNNIDSYDSNDKNSNNIHNKF